MTGNSVPPDLNEDLRQELDSHQSFPQFIHGRVYTPFPSSSWLPPINRCFSLFSLPSPQNTHVQIFTTFQLRPSLYFVTPFKDNWPHTSGGGGRCYLRPSRVSKVFTFFHLLRRKRNEIKTTVRN